MSLIEKAKVAEQAERYEDMVKYMKKHVEESESSLEPEDRNLLSVAYKNVIGTKRSAFRVLSSLISKCSNEVEKENIKSYRDTILGELRDVCEEVYALLDKHLLKHESDSEAKVFYCKMKGDYHRYWAEAVSEEESEEAKKSAQDAYKKATDAAESLSTTHPVRLGLALNYSVYYYEIAGDKQKACEIAKKAFDDAIGDLEPTQASQTYKDSTLILQLLRDNLTLWTSDNPDDEDGY